ncbi:hypothetical protein B0H15DRAFT_818786 [Mycena belliarum]|uniref:Uncharacterized protein n=1 Tax=Mycena belliarum TaxID=1033014 RepID=A0AAD6XXR6_9AGAR|nr:hypothetical protein B0H15DRAFT_818786 [Mycena belliae]
MGAPSVRSVTAVFATCCVGGGVFGGCFVNVVLSAGSESRLVNARTRRDGTTQGWAPAPLDGSPHRGKMRIEGVLRARGCSVSNTRLHSTCCSSGEDRRWAVRRSVHSLGESRSGRAAGFRRGDSEGIGCIRRWRDMERWARRAQNRMAILTLVAWRIGIRAARASVVAPL